MRSRFNVRLHFQCSSTLLRPEYTRPPIPVFTTLADIRWAQAQQILTKLVSIELDTLKSIWAVANTLTAVTSSAQLPPVESVWSSRANVSLLIAIYRQYPLLWNIRHENHKNRILTDQVYQNILQEMQKTVPDLALLVMMRAAHPTTSSSDAMITLAACHTHQEYVLTSVQVSLRTSLSRLLLRLSSLWVLSVWV